MLNMMNFFDLSRQLNLRDKPASNLPYHPPQGRYKTVHQGLIIPGLPAPLYYLNFSTLIGQPSVPMLLNSSAVLTYPLDTATVMASCSPHMSGHLKRYSIAKDCKLRPENFQFAQTDFIYGKFPDFQFHRQDQEFSLDLQVTTTTKVSHLSKLYFHLVEYWSLLCHCQGSVIYQGKHYEVAGMGAFEYARAVQIPYFPLCFWTYQLINLDANNQIILIHIRNHANRVVQSRCYIRHRSGQNEFYEQKQIQFKVHRVYPWVQTPNGQRMYLPREFSWQIYKGQKLYLTVQAQSRGDFKFGLAAGYVGSFRYDIHFNGQNYVGESGYCEYVDCRPLKWQENNEKSFFKEKLLNTEPCFLKK